MDPRQNLTNLTCKVNRLAYKLIPVEYVPTSPTGTLVVNSELYVSNNINVENCLNFVNNDNICIGIGTGTQPFGPYYPPTPYFQRHVEGPSDSWRNRALPETGTPEWEAFRAERRALRSTAAPRTDPDNNYSNITIGHDSVPTASQDLFNIAIGYEAVNGGGTGDTGSTGYFYPGQGEANVAIGVQSAYEGQFVGNVAVGAIAGFSGQGLLNTAVGPGAAYYGQGSFNVAVGMDAAFDGQTESNIAIGYEAGFYNQDTNNIAIGNDAGFNGQTTEAIAIGTNAAASGAPQTYRSIAIGSSAGAAALMPQNSVALGPVANVLGGGSPSYNGVAIGSGASSQRGAIVLTSNNSGLAGTTGTLYVNPLVETTRTTNTYLMNYNTSTSQVGYRYQLDTGLDSTNASSGTTTFSTPFATIPNVTASLINSGVNWFYGVTINSITTNGFSWTKYVITGAPGTAFINNTSPQPISWIAVGITTAPPS